QHLVERLLTLVVGHDGPTSALADGVDLVDEDDGGRRLAGSREQIAHPRRTYADEELDEAGPGQGEEGDVGLAGDGPGQQGRARARRPDHEDTAGPHGAGRRVALGVLEEVDDLADLTLCPVVARHVAEARRR